MKARPSGSRADRILGRRTGRPLGRRPFTTRAMGAEVPSPASFIALASPIGLAAYWWLVLVPQERRALAKSKRRGSLSSYLDELEGDDSRALERWFYTDWRKKRQEKAERDARRRASIADAERRGASSPSPADIELELEREADAAAAEDPSCLSLDNPDVVALLALALLSAVAALRG